MTTPDLIHLSWSGRLDLNQRPLHPEFIGIPNNRGNLHLSLNDFKPLASLTVPSIPYWSKKCDHFLGVITLKSLN
jgi:hypothetical protein